MKSKLKNPPRGGVESDNTDRLTCNFDLAAGTEGTDLIITCNFRLAAGTEGTLTCNFHLAAGTEGAREQSASEGKGGIPTTGIFLKLPSGCRNATRTAQCECAATFVQPYKYNV